MKADPIPCKHCDGVGSTAKGHAVCTACGGTGQDIWTMAQRIKSAEKVLVAVKYQMTGTSTERRMGVLSKIGVHFRQFTGERAP